MWTPLTRDGRRVRLGSQAQGLEEMQQGLSNAVTFRTIGSQSSPCGFGLEEEGLSWRSAYEDQAAKTAWKPERTVDAPVLLFARQGDSLWGISQSASQRDADQWLKAWMLYLWLAASVGVYGAVHVDCGAVLLSQNGLPDSISNAADIRMLTMSMPECQV